MSNFRFPVPALEQALAPPRMEDETVRKFLSQRRSTPIKMMDATSAGPSKTEMDEILNCAMRVPDHRQLTPWRFIIFEGENRAKFGNVLKARHLALHPEATPAELEIERNRLMRATTCITVISSPDVAHKTPVWEQELSAGALCMNVLYAANALGFGASWISEWWAFDTEIDAALGLTSDERVAGHIFLGQSAGSSFERKRPDLADKVTNWSG